MSEPGNKSFSGQVVLLGFVQVILKLRLLITIPILSRFIGAGGYGTWSLVMAFAGMMQTLILLGTNSSLRVFVPWEKSLEKQTREFWGLIQVVCGELLAAAVVLLAFKQGMISIFFRDGILPAHYYMAVALVPLYTINALFMSQAINNRQAGAYTRILALITLVELCFLIVAVYYFGLTGVLVSMIFKQALLLLFMGRAILRHNRFMPLKREFVKDVRKYYSYGFFLFAAGFAAWAIDSSDRLIIGNMRGMTELGVYQMSYGLAASIIDLAQPIYSILLPFVAAAIADSQIDMARHYLEKSVRVLLLIYVPVVIMLSMAGGDILRVLTVPAFFSGAMIIPWVVMGLAVYQTFGVYEYTLQAYKKGHLVTISVAVAATCNIVLNFIFVPRYGMIAAAVSTFIAYMVHFIIMRTVASRYLRIHYNMTFLAKLGMAGAALWGAMAAVQALVAAPLFRLAGSLAAGGACFLAVVLATNCVPADERKQLLDLLRKPRPAAAVPVPDHDPPGGAGDQGI